MTSFLKKTEITAGAEYLEDDLPGNLSEAEVRKKVDWWIERDQDDHGRGGYSGTWAEVHGVKFPNKVFATKKEASDWLVANAQKWEEAVAVKFKAKKFKEGVSRDAFNLQLEGMLKLDKGIGKKKEMLDKVEAKYIENIKKLIDAKNKLNGKLAATDKNHIACPNCKSKIAKQYVKKSDTDTAEELHINHPKFSRYNWTDLSNTGVMTCPACEKSMIPTMAQKKLKDAIVKLDEQRKAIQKRLEDYESHKAGVKGKLLEKHTDQSDMWLVGAWASS